MKVKNLYNFILHPKSYINNLAEKVAKEEIRKNGFIPINEHKDQDIFLVAFPKSGITWLQSLVAGLQYGIDTEFLPDKLVQEIVPDIYDKKYYKRFGDIKIFKSHELPQESYKRVIYLVRDGRDAMVSYLHFNHKWNINVTLEEMIKENKNVYPAPWWQHVKAWTENPYNSEILYIRYEDLLENTAKELKRICEFIGIERDDELIKRIATGSTFDKMKQKAKKYDGLGHSRWQGEKGQEFFRKGKSGTYKEEMPENLIEYFTEKAYQELKQYGYEA